MGRNDLGSSDQMNILIASDVTASHLTGGAPRVMRAQARCLADRGHQVVILAKGDPDDRSAGEPVKLPGGATEIQVPWEGGRGPSGFLRLRRNARLQLDLSLPDWTPDVIMIQQPIIAGGVINNQRLKDVPALYVCHSFAFEEYHTREQRGRLLRGLGSAWLRSEERKLLRRSLKVVVLSDYTRKKLLETYSISDTVVIIPGGVDSVFHPVSASQRESLREKFGMEGFSFLTVRNLVSRTGVDMLIDAFSQLRACHPGTRLWIAGEGPLRSKIQEKIEHHGLNDSVKLLGFVTDDTLPDLYRAADCFVLPTLFLEGFGLVTIEALASGTPVVATPAGANLQVVGEWREDAVVDSITPIALASGMEHMLGLLQHDSVSLRISCSEYGSRFTWDRHVDLLEKELLNLTGEN